MALVAVLLMLPLLGEGERPRDVFLQQTASTRMLSKVRSLLLRWLKLQRAIASGERKKYLPMPDGSDAKQRKGCAADQPVLHRSTAEASESMQSSSTTMMDICK